MVSDVSSDAKMGFSSFEKALLLRSPRVADALSSSDKDEAELREAATHYDAGRFADAADCAAQLSSPAAALLSAVCAIDRLIASNWTGPVAEDADGGASLQQLCVDGERPLSGVRGAPLVSAAAAHLSVAAAAQMPSAAWWRARLSVLHQRLMASPCASLRSAADAGFSAAIDAAKPAADALEACALVERALMHVHYRDTSRARKDVERAMEALGLRVELAGAQGRRTKYQEKDTPQLYLAVLDQKPSLLDAAAAAPAEGAAKDVPCEVPLGDESDLLEHTLFSDAIDAFVLRPEEQACVLVLGALHTLRAAEAGDDVRREEALAFSNRVLRDQNDWSLQAMALLSKCRVEQHSHKTSLRALAQLQSLAGLISSASASVKARISRQHLVLFPSHPELQRELGHMLAALGDPAAAVKLFEETEMLDEAVLCLAMSGQKAKAEDLCRRRLELKPEPEMLCVLGDITDDREHYDRAWSAFSPKFARAKRSLGHWCVKRQMWAEAIQHYREALSVNSLFSRCWFALGCAAMQLSRWQEALEAFSRVVALDPDDGEAWSNIAAVHMHTGNAQEAQGALQEAMRHKPNSWRIIQNYVLICTSPQVRDYRSALFGIGRLLDVAAAVATDDASQMAKRIDPRVLFALVSAVLENKPTRTGDGAQAIKQQLERMLARIERDADMSPALWDIAALYAEATNDWKTAMTRRSHHAHSLEGSWPGDAKRWADVSEAYVALGMASLRLKDAACVPRLQSVVDRARAHHANTRPFATLVALVAKLSAL